MGKKVRRIIIDTNLWISFLITKDFIKLDEIIFSRQGILVFSQELLEEFLEVSGRPKFRRFFSSNDIEEILQTIGEYADYIKVQTQVDLCRDSKDNFLLSLALDGKADYLLTGDKDLLELATFGGTEIITLSEFLLKEYP
jgi:uncharacterized protein